MGVGATVDVGRQCGRPADQDRRPVNRLERIQIQVRELELDLMALAGYEYRPAHQVYMLGRAGAGSWQQAAWPVRAEHPSE